MADRANEAWLNPRYLLIALLPALVFSLSSLVISVYAAPFDVAPARFAEFDVNREGAARVGVLATFMLFTGAALAALFFFAYTLRMFGRRRRIMPVLAFLAMAFAAILVSKAGEWISGNKHDMHDFAGRTFVCLAVSYTKGQSDLARAPRAAVPPAPAAQAGAPPRQSQAEGVEVARLRDGRDCQSEPARKMQSLGTWQFWGVVFSFASLVIGAICCLAIPAGGKPSDDEAASHAAIPPTPVAPPEAEPVPAADPALLHWERQSEWLNTYLYLTAFLLATALLFLNAYLRWPGYVLLDAARYHEHIAALVSYYGIVFSIMLAAFYIPVAIILAGKVKALKPATAGESKLPDAFKGPAQILKIVLGLFSTTLAGALPGILNMI